MEEKKTCRACPGGPEAKERARVRDGRDGRLGAALEKIRYKLFVMSGKGGVGKSSVAVNVACALADAGARVGLLDVDLHGPSVTRMLGITGAMEAGRGAAIAPKRFGENLLVVSMQSLLGDPDQAVLWRGPMKTTAIRQFLADVDWGELDYLVIDSPPGTGDEHLTILKTVRDALCVLVTTPQEISLADVRKTVNFLQYANANILGVVENMSGLVCPHCHTEIELFKKGGGEEMARAFGLEFLGAVPLDPATVVAGDLGRPVVQLDGDFPARQAFINLAATIAAACRSSLEAAASPCP
uniref:Iron-sulfur cluster carrier protein n=1 Tax=Desulfovibrio sp. U5L TaxID=596152 RepID=I2Q181_9BACT